MLNQFVQIFAFGYIVWTLEEFCILNIDEHFILRKYWLTCDLCFILFEAYLSGIRRRQIHICDQIQKVPRVYNVHWNHIGSDRRGLRLFQRCELSIL